MEDGKAFRDEMEDFYGMEREKILRSRIEKAFSILSFTLVTWTKKKNSKFALF